MKTTTKKTRRYKVGNYRAWKQGSRIVIGYKDDGKWITEAVFTKQDVQKLRAALAVDEEARRKELDVQLRLQREAVDKLRSALFAARLQRNALDKKRNSIGRVVIGRYTAGRQDDGDVYVGCTKFSQKQFDKLAKLVE